jgi:hypothetical protein
LAAVPRWSAPLAALAIFLAGLAALTFTPEADSTAGGGLAGWPRLGLYAAAGTLVALSAAPACITYTLRTRCGVGARGYALLALGAIAGVTVALVNARRLLEDIADPLGPWLWLASMALLLGYTLFPQARRVGWHALWPAHAPLEAARLPALARAAAPRWLAPTLIVGVLLVAAVLRLPDLGSLPRGINPDEGDRAATSFDVLNGVSPQSWFDSGWFMISMFYFRALALSMAAFGPDVAGGRMLTALLGIAFVAVVAWIGWRQFGARAGVLAAAFATGIQISIQYSRLITEAGPTALLWALSIGGFLEGARTGRAWGWAVAGLSGGLGLYFYPSARLWAGGAVLTALVLLVFVRDRRVLPGIGLAALASLVAAAPFLVHLSRYPQETAARYLQTAVVDPHNQERLAYLAPPEPLSRLVALQVERTLGMFDRYADGGGFLPTGHPLFGVPLAQLALVGAFYVVVRGWRDARLAVLAIWLWVGLFGVAATVETPDYLRAVGLLPSLCCVLALLVLDVVDRGVSLVPEVRRAALAAAVPAVIVAALLVPEVQGYFETFRTLPGAWASQNHEGEIIKALGGNGPVYSVEMNEHLVNSGWVRLLAPTAMRGRVPNPGSELPIVQPARTSQAGSVAPEVYPRAGQGLSLLLSPDPNQLTYVPILQALYPRAEQGDGGGDGRVSVTLSPSALALTQGVTLVSATGAARHVSTFGDIPEDLAAPVDLTWRAGVRLSPGGRYRLALTAPGRAQLRVDGESVLDTTGAGQVDVLAADGLHFVELHAPVASVTDHVQLTVDGLTLSPQQTFAPMNAPWGLVARLGQPLFNQRVVHLDAMVAMAFFEPELGPVVQPNSVVWSGTLLAPRSGTYRMAFAAEDAMQLQIDGTPVDVLTTSPDGWRDVGMGSTVQLPGGAHRVEVRLDITHGARELARWNWAPPRDDGAVDSQAGWSVVPPWALRPDPSVQVAD